MITTSDTKQPHSTSRLSATKILPQVMPAGAWTIVQWDTVIFDVLEEFHVAGGHWYFQPTRAGYYLIHVQLSWNPLEPAAQQNGIALYDIAGIAHDVSWTERTTFGYYTMNQITRIRYLTPNDTIEVRADTTNVPNWSIAGATTTCVFQVHRLT